MATLQEIYDEFLETLDSAAADKLTDELARCTDGFKRNATMERQLRARGGVPAQQPQQVNTHMVQEAFLTACASGDTMRVAALLQQNSADVNYSDAHGQSGLLLAAIHRREATVAMLLAAGADATQATDDACTPLHTLAELVEHGDRVADPIPDEAGARLVERILNGDGQLLEMRDCNGLTPLAAAVYHGNVDVARALVQSGADVDAADPGGSIGAVLSGPPEGCTPLILCFTGYAKGRSQTSLVELLLDAGAAVPGATDANGLTARDYASTSRRPDLVQLLQEYEDDETQ
jgi:ankyrin repeat protein